LFAVRHEKNARQTIFLPSVFFLPCAVENMHGKAALCRAPEILRTANIETHDKRPFSSSVYIVATLNFHCFLQQSL
jgi:hypothetical protein